MIQNVKFNRTSNQFQSKLAKDIENIKKSDKLLIPADKTTNFYRVSPEQHNKLLEDNITKDYKKAPIALETEINTGDKKIATAIDLDDRIKMTAKSQAFITLKDHKQNFRNNPKCRLINPTKSEIGIISKKILERVNAKIKSKTGLNQWKNTNEVIQWYKAIDNKPKSSFICFDVVEFYPSITEELLRKAIEFAKKYDELDDQEIETITHVKKSLLYSKDEPWCKKGASNFDVTMGSYDGAETCELIGLFMLSQLQNLGINVGLYRDDGLAVCKKSPRQTEQLKKEICRIFANNKLKVTIEANMKTIDFLDITMNLTTSEYKPYMKPNNSPLYVHKSSNHPPSIIKNLPESINKRLSTISSNEKAFKDSIQPYQAALTNSGYSTKLEYNPPQPTPHGNSTNKKRKRKRHITWFNPPYSINVTTNIGKEFLRLLDKSFPTNNPLHKILNRNTVKISYSTMPNMKQIISAHNKSILRQDTPQENPGCNCRRGRTCPLDGQCQTKGVIYQATVTRDDTNKSETYIGLTENSFKTRFNAHNSSFRNSNNRHATTLSHHIWTLKDNNIPHSVSWKIVAKSQAYTPATDKCNLCLLEKYHIIFKPHMATLNNRHELYSACRHKKKFLLCNAPG